LRSSGSAARASAIGHLYGQEAAVVDDDRSGTRGAEASPTPRRIVIVEDSRDSREMLRFFLEHVGHEVHEAADGPSGLRTILEMRPDVALVDVGLPGLDGYEVARRVRADDGGRAVRLVALTGHAQPEDRERSEGAGFDAHLVKPVDPMRLAAVIRGGRGA
jgi:CheY-like chemotaxis protein